MRQITLTIIGLLAGGALNSLLQPEPVEPPRNERYWSALIAEDQGGIAEYRTPDGSRVDVLTDEYATEVEWVKKRPESIGQSVFYGLATNRKPAVILLLKGEPNETRYYLRCLSVCGKLGIRIETRKVD